MITPSLSKRDYLAVFAPSKEVQELRELGKHGEMTSWGSPRLTYKYTTQEARYRYADAMIAASNQKQ